MGAEFWEDHVAAAKHETISASEYAKRHNISVTALYYWQHKLKITTTSTHKKISTLSKPAHASAIIYSLIETAKVNDIELHTWLAMRWNICQQPKPLIKWRGNKGGICLK